MNNAAVQVIKVVQYTLDGFVKGKPLMDEVICRRLMQNQKLMSEVQVALLNEDHTNHFLNLCIPKTSNSVEEYYCQTDPRKMKKQYRTIPGLICALKLKSIYWIVRNGFISEED